MIEFLRQTLGSRSSQSGQAETKILTAAFGNADCLDEDCALPAVNTAAAVQ